MMTDLAEKIRERSWFYRMSLPDGSTTPTTVPEEILAFHEHRRLIVDAVVERTFGTRWESLRVLDLACHEGYFASHLARRGAADVVGVDIRPENLQGAGLIRDAFELSNLRLVQRDVFDLEPGELGSFDVVLVLGLLYHVDDPMGVLRRARSHLSTGICIVETQVAPNLSGVLDWGSYRNPKPILGSIALIDETAELSQGNREASVFSLSFCPSVEALGVMMRASGFSRTEVAGAPPTFDDQLSTGKRVIMVGHTAES
jgi:SAM-dependent methyltransferase